MLRNIPYAQLLNCANPTQGHLVSGNRDCHPLQVFQTDTKCSYQSFEDFCISINSTLANVKGGNCKDFCLLNRHLEIGFQFIWLMYTASHSSWEVFAQ